MTLQIPYQCIPKRKPYTEQNIVEIHTDTDSLLQELGEVQMRQYSPYYFVTIFYVQTSSMPSSSWNVRDKRRQVMVLFFFVKRIKSFPIRMEPLETDFRQHVILDDQYVSAN